MLSALKPLFIEAKTISAKKLSSYKNILLNAVIDTQTNSSSQILIFQSSVSMHIFIAIKKKFQPVGDVHTKHGCLPYG